MKRTFLSDSHLKDTPFAAPDGYFESLTARVMQQLPEQPQADTAPCITPLPKRNTWAPWAAIAAAACIAVAIFFTQPVTPTTAPAAQIAEIVTDTYDDDYRETALQYALVDNQTIYNYLAGNY